MTLRRLAPAKINLFLHVGARQADGYHPVCSLMIFADIGDELGLTPGAPMGLTVEGPFGGGLGDGGDNLVLRARDLFLGRFGRASEPFGLTLDKRLPIAAGLGGGSADAAASLQLLASRHGVDASHPDLDAMARALGADVAACLAGRTVIAEGRGDDLTPAPVMPALDAVLVNPDAPSATAAVYRVFDGHPAGSGADAAKSVRHSAYIAVLASVRGSLTVFSGAPWQVSSRGTAFRRRETPRYGCAGASRHAPPGGADAASHGT